MATMKDVARIAGVSTSTVSHVINKDRFVSEAITAKVDAAIKSLNYAPSALARSLKLNQTRTIGMLITGILLALVPLAVISLTGPDNVTEVATLAWGQALGSWAMFVANIFALCAMMTSYWAVGGSMLTNIVDMFKFKSENHVPTRLISLACVALPPFILAYSGLVSFVDAIYLAGTFGGVIMSILPALMVNSARKNGDMEPPWKCGWYSARWVQVLIITLFCAAALYAVLDLVGILPSGW